MSDDYDDEMVTTFRCVTDGIAVSVTPTFLEQRSDPEADLYFWAYEVNIHNGQGVPVQLKSRYWHITDAGGVVNEVRGAGVVGKQPHLEPGESFEYVSGTPLNTPSGIMVGTYTMELDGGVPLEVAIPAFSLDSPYNNQLLN
jgi:ApaG protein